MALSFGLHFVILHVDFLAVVFQITPLSFAQWMVVINSHCPSFYWTSCSNGLPEITLTLLEKDLIKRKSSVSKPKNVKKSLIISPILHHSQTVEDCLRKRRKKKNWKFKEEKNVHNSFNFVFFPNYAINWQPLKRKKFNNLTVCHQKGTNAKRH